MSTPGPPWMNFKVTVPDDYLCPVCTELLKEPYLKGKVVQKVTANEFVDLRELLPYNVSLLEKLEGLPVAPGGTRPRLREVSSLLTLPSHHSVQDENLLLAHESTVR